MRSLAGAFLLAMLLPAPLAAGPGPDELRPVETGQSAAQPPSSVPAAADSVVS